MSASPWWCFADAIELPGPHTFAHFPKVLHAHQNKARLAMMRDRHGFFGGGVSYCADLLGEFDGAKTAQGDAPSGIFRIYRYYGLLESARTSPGMPVERAKRLASSGRQKAGSKSFANIIQIIYIG